MSENIDGALESESSKAELDSVEDFGKKLTAEQLEIKKLRDENARRRLKEKETADKLKELNDNYAKKNEQIESIQKELKEAKLAKHGIEGEAYELYSFYESKGLTESEAIEKVKSILPSAVSSQQKSTLTPKHISQNNQTGILGKQNISAKIEPIVPTSFSKMKLHEKIRLLQDNPSLYHKLLREFKGE